MHQPLADIGISADGESAILPPFILKAMCVDTWEGDKGGGNIGSGEGGGVNR